MVREAHVIVTPPEAKAFAHVLDKLEVSAGRDLSADLTIEDSLLSRVHLRFVFDGERWCVEDQGSRNGTFVAGKRVGKGERAALEDGVEVTAGLTKLKFVRGELSAASPPLRRVARPTEDFFAISELLADGAVDMPAEITRLLIRASEELVPERTPERVLAAACGIAQSVLAATAVSVQRAGERACEIIAGSGAPVAVDVVRPLLDHRGARVTHGDAMRKLIIAVDAPRQCVLVAEVPQATDERKLKVVVALASLMSGVYESAVSHKELRRDNQRLLDQVRAGFAYDVDNPACLAGRSTSAQRLREAVEKAAKSDEPLTIAGEPGVGKELIARAIHARSPRSADPFVVVDAAKPAGLGRYHGLSGVLFVEHGEALSPASLRDVQQLKGPRVIVATTAPAPDALHVPPLRARVEDVLLVAERLLDELNRHHKHSCSLAPDAIAWLAGRPFKENVRELAAMLERALFVAEGGTIMKSDFDEPKSGSEALPLPDAIAEFEKEYVLRVLQAQHGHRIRTAAILGISRQALGRKLRAYGLIGGDDDE